ncbi:pyridoxal-phosphate dependent enzyme [Candidatus Dependentiae bacterium]|nr:pyridoxal-phosphate dependent enzyme [Candidatus Dependentiae bacterium]
MKKLFIFFIINMTMCANYDRLVLANLYSYYNIPDAYKNILEPLASDSKLQKKIVISKSSLPLFQKFSDLREKLSHVELCDLPSPIIKCPNLEEFFQLKNFSIKDDGQIGKIVDGGKLYSGNKARKLEFLLADAMSCGVKNVLTFGMAGSNHALATTIYTNLIGLKSICMLKPQHNDYTLQRNLLLQKYYGAELIYCLNDDMRIFLTCAQLVKNKLELGEFPYVIPTGGSCPLGVIGYVNAAFELHDQIKNKIICEPDLIYLPLGSAGTAAGLILGIKLLKLKSKIVLVAVEPTDIKELEKKLFKLINDANELLHELDSNIPQIKIETDDYEILTEHCGDDYALYTIEEIESMNLIKKLESIKLDGVYTGKTFAGMLKHILKNNLIDKNILFWNTFCSDDFKTLTNTIDYKNLPTPFHKYFEEDVQPFCKLLN